MLFSSIPFLYYFLPVVLTVYFLVPRKLKNSVLLLSSLIGGGICGLAGLIQACGMEHTLNDQMGNSMGYTAACIAYMAQMSPAAVLVFAFMFAILFQGSAFMQIAMQIPAATGDVIQGIILLFILGGEFFSTYRIVWTKTDKEVTK